jgi:integrase
MPALAGILQQSGFSGFSMVAGTGFDPPPPRARTVAALRCFFRFYVESGYLERDPSARAAHAEDARGAARRVLDRAELSRLLDVPRPQSSEPALFLGVHGRLRLASSVLLR